MTQKVMMVVEQPRPVVMQTTEFVRGGGSSDYDALINKPAINGVTLEGDKTTAELGLPTKTSDLENDSGFITSVPVTSVNGQTGAVVLTASDVGAGTYSKPSGGIPKTDLASAVQTSLGKADAAYQKPAGGIPASDLAAAVQTSLGKADTALQSAPVTSVNGQTGAVTINVPSLTGYQTEAITDTGGYYTTDTVEGALQEIGAELAGKADKIAVTASDNGKFLRVVNGAWAAQAVPAAESNSFGGGS